MNRKLLSLPILVLFVFSVLSVNITIVSAGDPPAIYVDPPATTGAGYIRGTFFTLAIKTNYTGDNPFTNYIISYEFTLSYDSSILNGVEVTNGDLIDGVGATFVPGPFDNEAGELSRTVAFYDPGGEVVSGPGTLAYVTFKVVGIGPSEITIGPTTQLIGWNWFAEPEYYPIIDAATMPTQIQHGTFDNTGAPDWDIPVAVITASDEEPVNEPVTFSGADSSDPDGTDIVSYEWDFGDETTGTGETVDHTYIIPGIYTVTLVVTDEQTQVSDPVYHTIAINERPPYAADLVKWKAKAETHLWDYSKDEDKNVTLTALAANLGTDPVNVSITFAILDARYGTLIPPAPVEERTLAVGETLPVSVLLDPTEYDFDGYTKKVLFAHVTLTYDSNGDGTPDTDASTKLVRFAIVP